MKINHLAQNPARSTFSRWISAHEIDQKLYGRLVVAIVKSLGSYPHGCRLHTMLETHHALAEAGVYAVKHVLRDMMLEGMVTDTWLQRWDKRGQLDYDTDAWKLQEGWIKQMGTLPAQFLEPIIADELTYWGGVLEAEGQGEDDIALELARSEMEMRSRGIAPDPRGPMWSQPVPQGSES